MEQHTDILFISITVMNILTNGMYNAITYLFNRVKIVYTSFVKKIIDSITVISECNNTMHH